MIRHFRRGFASAIGAALAALLLARPAAAEPAMWVARDADSTIYLLGTFHLVKPGIDWRSAKMERALEESAELWLETITEGSEAALVPLILKHGLDPKRPLSSRLDAEAKARLDAAARTAGMPPGKVYPMRPWLAALTVAVAPLIAAGYDPKLGVDRALEAAARAERKPVRAFETPSEQLMVFANLPEEAEMALLQGALEEADGGKELVDRMSEAWLEGDVEELEAMSSAKFRAEEPVLYEAVYLNRNRAWAAKIAEMMQGAGTVFIAVGAGHLRGEDSVPDLLAERGIAVERY